MADHVSGVEPRPDGWERIRAGSRRRRWYVPVTAAAAVLALVAGLGIALDRRGGTAPARPAGSPADLYLETGSVWPLQSRSEAEAWRRDPDAAPYLADPERTAAEFLRTVLGVTGELLLEPHGPDLVNVFVRGRPFILSVARAPGEQGPWVVANVGLDGGNAMPRHWRERAFVITSPVEVSVTPLADRYAVEVLELRDGRYDVLGSVPFDGDPEACCPDGLGWPAVTFQEPSAGFGVIAVRGYDARGALIRAHYVPASFRDPWLPRR